jgi:hypothetical protein
MLLKENNSKEREAESCMRLKLSKELVVLSYEGNSDGAEST